MVGKRTLLHLLVVVVVVSPFFYSLLSHPRANDIRAIIQS